LTNSENHSVFCAAGGVVARGESAARNLSHKYEAILRWMARSLTSRK
jgi:hypothetical protein